MKLLQTIRKDTIVNFLYFIVFSVVIQSCTFNPYNYTYIQTPVNVTDLQKKGDLRVDGYVWANHADGQASYALSNRFGIIAGYNQGFKNSIQYGEAGIGYFSSAEKIIRLGLFAGAGIGTVSVDYKITRESQSEEYYYDLSSQYNKFFVQPSIGFQLSKKMLLSTTFRLSYVDFQSYSYLFENYSIDSLGNKIEDLYNWSYHSETTSPQGIFILDPSSTITVNVMKNLAFIGTVNYSVPIALSSNFRGPHNLMSAFSRPKEPYHDSSNEYFNHPIYSNLAIHIGLRFRMNTCKNQP